MALTKIPYQPGDVLSAEQVNNMQDAIINLEKSKDVNLNFFTPMMTETEVNNYILRQIKLGKFKSSCKTTIPGAFFGSGYDAYGLMTVGYFDGCIFVEIHTRYKIMTNLARPVDYSNPSGEWTLDGWNTLVDITPTN